MDRRPQGPRGAVSLLLAVALSAPTLWAQTAIKLPKNRYTPAAGRGVGARGGRRGTPPVPDHRRRAHHGLPAHARRPARRRRAGRPQAAGLRVLVHSRQPEGDQRIRPAGRTDVRPPRDVRCRGVRGRGRRRDGPRAVARVAAARHGERHEGAESVAPARSGRRCPGRRDRRRGGGIGDRAGQPVRPRHAAPQVQSRLREAGRPARRADHGACRLRPTRARPHVRDHRA